MKKQPYFDDPKIFKQTRADGTELFFVHLTERSRWFFGLLPWKTKYFVYKADKFFLIKRFYGFSWPFRSVEEAKSGAKEAIETRCEHKAYETIVSFERVK